MYNYSFKLLWTFPSADSHILNLSYPRPVTFCRQAQFEDHTLSITDLCRYGRDLIIELSNILNDARWSSEKNETQVFFLKHIILYLIELDSL